MDNSTRPLPAITMGQDDREKAAKIEQHLSAKHGRKHVISNLNATSNESSLNRSIEASPGNNPGGFHFITASAHHTA
jgi:hypothetical protein